MFKENYLLVNVDHLIKLCNQNYVNMVVVFLKYLFETLY